MGECYIIVLYQLDIIRSYSLCFHINLVVCHPECDKLNITVSMGITT